MQRRPIILTFRVTETERDYLNALAASRGLSRSGLLRLALAQLEALKGSA